MVQSRRDQNGVKSSIILNQLPEISSLKLVNNQGRDIIGGIQSRFVYQFSFPDCYEPMED